MEKVLVLEAERSAYSIDQVRETMTVGDLLLFLSDFDEDMPVYLSHDNGYTFGGIKMGDFEEREEEGTKL